MTEKLQEVFDLLEIERAEIFELLDKSPSAKLHAKPSQKSWSVIQVIDHMLQVERSSLLYVKKKIKAGSSIPNASWSSGFRTFLLICFLNAPLKFKAPKSLKEPANEKELDELLHIWNAVRKDLKKFIADYPMALNDKEIFKHPISGRIKLDQMLQFFRAHQKHHVLQINRTLKAVNV